MSVKSEPYYWVVCDRCGESVDYGDFSAMRQPDIAVQYATDSDWITVVGEGHVELHYCDDCTIWSDAEDKRVPDPDPYPYRVEEARP